MIQRTRGAGSFASLAGTSKRASSKSREFFLSHRVALPAKTNFPMISLSSADREGRKRIRPEKPVIKGGIFPPNSR